ncbi:MAG: polysaccharide pyruvyl transferase family protein [bacterium]
MNILIIEAYTDANVGSSALVENSIRICQMRFPGSKIQVMAHHPQSLENMHGCKAVQDVYDYPLLQPRGKQVIWLIRQLICMALAWKMAKKRECTLRVPGKIPQWNLESFFWADLIISIGAERLNDKFYKGIPFSVFTYLLCKRMGKRVVLFPQTIGPFFFIWSRIIIIKALRAVDQIYVRDEESYRIVTGQLGIDSAKVIRSPDMAILQTPIQPARARKLISLKSEEKVVGISALRWNYFKNKAETPYASYQSYRREMAHLADELIDRYRIRIIFFPTNFQVHGCREDDVKTAEEIYHLMLHKERAMIIRRLPSPAELQGMLGCCEINITTRMHACILSTCAYVPTISVNYLFKIKEYMESLGLGAFSIDIEDFHAEAVLPLFDRLWGERESWRRHLTAAVAHKRSLLMQAMEALEA